MMTTTTTIRKRVLVAEDNAVNAELIHEFLEMRGYEAIEAANGLDALEKIEACHPDVVLLDIQMPVLDGFEVIRRIRSDARHHHLHVIALTAYAMRGDREKVLAAGFDEYVTKPIDFEVLLCAIRRKVMGQKKEAFSAKPKIPISASSFIA
jgi:two-component system cell cycle response regulator DivK